MDEIKPTSSTLSITPVKESYSWDWLGYMVAFVLLLAMFGFVFLAGTWYADSHHAVLSPISTGVENAKP